MAIHKYQAFLRVVELGSITKAADCLGYTQSAVSRMIADLEDEWGIELLHRSRAGLSLSSDGIMIMPYIKELCDSYNIMSEKVDHLKGLDTGFIRIGTITSISTQLLPLILKEFRSRYPNIEFQLKNMDRVEAEDALRAGEIDCCFISTPISESKRDKIQTRFLMRDPMVALLPCDHAMASYPLYPLQRFSGECYVKLTDEHRNEVSLLLDKINEQLDTPPATFYEVNDDYSVMAMVESGLGVSVLPKLVTNRMPFNVCIRELDPPQYRDIELAFLNDRASPATEKFIQVTIDFFEKLKR